MGSIAFLHLVANAHSGPSALPGRPRNDHMQYPVEVLNRAADIFRMAGHMLGQRLLLRLGLVVSVDDGPQPFPRRRD